MKPVLDTINLIEDRIEVFLGEDNLAPKVGRDGLITYERLRVIDSYIFLRKLSSDLTKFHTGEY